MGNALIGRNLSKIYESGAGGTIALRTASFAIEEGERVAILGPSGCGKSTLLNIMGLLTPPTGGELEVDGLAAHQLGARKMAAYRNRYFGYIVQGFALVEEATALQNVEIPLLYAPERLGRKARIKAVRDALAILGIEDKLKETVKTLSGGERQRVAIARAMVNNPAIILADEPTGALDTATGQAVMDSLAAYVSAGKTLVMVTHDADVAERYCGRCLHMRDGRFAQ